MKPRARLLLALATLLAPACVSHIGGPAKPPRLSAPLAYAVERELRYVPPDWAEALHADLFRPRHAPGVQAAVVLIHGGAWARGSRAEMEGLGRLLAQQGFVALNIDYRLAPAHRFPAPLQDAQQAVRWLRANAQRLALDPQRIAAWGYSAGGEIAALLANLSPGDPNFDAGARVQALVAGGAPLDLARLTGDPLARQYIGEAYETAPERWHAASPLIWASADDAPAFLYHGSWDWLVHPMHTAAYRQRLEQAGVPSELYLVHGLEHLGTFLLSAGSRQAALDFLRRQLAPAAGGFAAAP